ncbi:NAD+ synthase [Aminithiophilus ramosus]|uniref:Glutamine-dependent NAD(+) synthetase n=1 Tax=Aminithiophilus ramosus TaxID=3029084 RepID=A0A9Q7AHC6_9BACT|nr:NAD+ synthase [Aminithiophilus ramosus]QTX31955.1 NAD+ synthase [Aminithiophilus ramosus]
MRIAAAQLNPTVGDVAGNVALLARAIASIPPGEADLVVAPELFLTGYPPLDLLEKGWFLESVGRGIADVAELSRSRPDLAVLFGAPRPTGGGRGKPLHNGALLVEAGLVVGEQAKTLLPTYDVFDEARHFAPAARNRTLPFRGERLGVTVCEDIWNDAGTWPGASLYDRDPVAEAVADGATMIVNLSASPFSMGKERLRFRLAERARQRFGLPLLYVNQVGGNDELLFDGRSFLLDGSGRATVLPGFRETTAVVDTERGEGEYVPLDDVGAVYEALVMGLRDYCRKCGFSRAILGLSGGIDSALTAVIAARALGPEAVTALAMPSPYSSRGSVDDSRLLARNLGIAFKVLPISEIFRTCLAEMAPILEGRGRALAEENLQARIRGNALMALSNATGGLVLSTGNKSELAMGYCTLYGDMDGGLALLADVPKTLVYALARHVNGPGEIIPGAVIDKPPSAELRPDQKDSDSLPPYEVLDAILERHIEEGASLSAIVADGFDEATVRSVLATVARNEYKRRQAAPGLRVTTKAFGLGRRMPLAARFSF